MPSQKQSHPFRRGAANTPGSTSYILGNSSSNSNISSPFKITTQILLLQGAYYISVLSLLLFTVLTSGWTYNNTNPSKSSKSSPAAPNPSPRRPLDLLLSWRSLRGDTAVGWTLALCWLVGGGLSGSILLLFLIGRSKLVLDFAITLHVIHFLLVFWWGGWEIPKTSLWWGLQLGGCTVMIMGGMWGCRWRELKPLNFGTGGTGSGAATSASSSGGRGGSRGRPEEYEMVSNAQNRRRGDLEGGGQK